MGFHVSKRSRSGRSAIPFLRTFLFIVFALGEAAAHASTEAVLERAYRDFTAFLEGEFDNQEQYYFDRNLELPPEVRHPRNHLRIVSIGETDSGVSLFHFRQYLDDNRDEPVRDQVLATSPVYESNVIRMDIFQKPERGADGGWRLDELGPPLCSIDWKPALDHFVGRVRSTPCDDGSEQALNARDPVLLSVSEFSIFHWGLEAGNETGLEIPSSRFRNRKARVFNCWMSVTHRDGENSTFRAGLKILDQGGRLWLHSEEQNPLTAGIKIRRVRWPTGNNRDSLVLYAHRPGEEKAVAYTWGDVDAERIAMNLRWMQASCTLSDDPWLPTAAVEP